MIRSRCLQNACQNGMRHAATALSCFLDVRNDAGLQISLRRLVIGFIAQDPLTFAWLDNCVACLTRTGQPCEPWCMYGSRRRCREAGGLGPGGISADPVARLDVSAARNPLCLPRHTATLRFLMQHRTFDITAATIVVLVRM